MTTCSVCQGRHGNVPHSHTHLCSNLVIWNSKCAFFGPRQPGQPHWLADPVHLQHFQWAWNSIHYLGCKVRRFWKIMAMLFRHCDSTLGRALTHPSESLVCILEGSCFATMRGSRFARGWSFQRDWSQSLETETPVHHLLTKPPKQSSCVCSPPCTSALQVLRVRKSYYLKSSELGFLFLDPEQRLDRKGTFPGKSKELLFGAPHTSKHFFFFKINTLDKDDP